MQFKNDKYCLTIDEINNKHCCGWYTRYDDLSDLLNIKTAFKKYQIAPSLDRPDVVASGMTINNCSGFEIKFEPNLKGGDTISISDLNGTPLYQYQIPLEGQMPDAIRYRLLEVIEPFVELNFAKVKNHLLDESIFSQYRRQIKERLSNMASSERDEAIYDLLAELKTSQHLLAAAYLDNCRYKDPQFLKELPQFQISRNEKIVIDMRGDITGKNWLPADDEGRWSGPESEQLLFLPMLVPGLYRIELLITDHNESKAGSRLSVIINGQKAELSDKGNEKPPYTLCGQFEIAPNNQDYMKLEFHINNDHVMEENIIPKFKLQKITISNINEQTDLISIM